MFLIYWYWVSKIYGTIVLWICFGTTMYWLYIHYAVLYLLIDIVIV
jgi:hypothetical protein